MENRDFLKTRIGVEIEMTGITREKAAAVLADYLEGTVQKKSDYYDTYIVTAPDGRYWKLMYDGSIKTQKKTKAGKVQAGSEYSVELVTPILTYDEDIDTLQEIVRRLRGAGAFSDAQQNGTGIHVHLDSKGHTPATIRNFLNIIYSKNDLLYESLQIEPNRMRFCKKLDAELVERMNKEKPKTMQEIEEIWYQGYASTRNTHYHASRYHFCNLHSLFHGVGTLELRAFNGSLHAGKLRAFLVLALALNNQALTQKCASPKKPNLENPKFAMRTWLNRIGFIGEEFKNCREHLVKHLRGCAAWRFRSVA
jgi:hypothetical protein